jgi:phenylacetate-CoA ligase
LPVIKNGLMHIPDIETKPLEEIKKYQEKKLAELLTYLQEHSKFYKELFCT